MRGRGTRPGGPEAETAPATCPPQSPEGRSWRTLTLQGEGEGSRPGGTARPAGGTSDGVDGTGATGAVAPSKVVGTHDKELVRV